MSEELGGVEYDTEDYKTQLRSAERTSLNLELTIRRALHTASNAIRIIEKVFGVEMPREVTEGIRTVNEFITVFRLIGYIFR